MPAVVNPLLPKASSPILVPSKPEPALGDLAICGDGKREGVEVCDEGNLISGDGCRGDCLKAELCGDSIIDQGEACDSGASNADTTPNACRTSCQRPMCGDSVLDDGEVCDDGDQSDLGACRADCLQLNNKK